MIRARDNRGREFKSLTDMAKFYHMKYPTLLQRLSNCKNFDDVFRPIGRSHKKRGPTTDHIGNNFKSYRAMCEHWNIGYSTFMARMRKHGCLQQALEQPAKCVGMRAYYEN